MPFRMFTISISNMSGAAARPPLDAGLLDGRGERGAQRRRRQQPRAVARRGRGRARLAGHAAAAGGAPAGRHVEQLPG